MKCPKCGNEVPDNSSFCNICGADINEITKTEPKELAASIDPTEDNYIPNKVKPVFKKPIIFISIAIVIIAAVVVILLTQKGVAAEFTECFNANQYDQALKIYTDKVATIKDVNSKKDIDNDIKKYLVGKIQKVKDEFVNNKLDYNTCTEQLKRISGYNIVLGEASAVTDFINKLNNSRLAFGAGKSYYGQKQYLSAIQKLNTVIKDDNNYDEAHKLLSDALTEAKKAQFTEAEQKYNNRDYQGAIDSINKITPYINDDETKGRLTFYQSEKQKADELEKQRLEQRKRELLAQTTRYVDNVTNDVTYVPKPYGDLIKFPSGGVIFYPYLRGEIDNNVFKLIAGVNQDNWIFMKEIDCNADGYMFKIEFDDLLDRQSEVGYGTGIYEWVEVVAFESPLLKDMPNPNLISDLGKLANAESALIKFQGDIYSRTYELTEKQKADLKNIIELHSYSKK